MILYQRIRLVGQIPLGEPGPLPPELAGLSDESVANLSWVDPALGYVGRGFLPVVVPDPLPPLPTEIPMHKAKKALVIGGWMPAVRAAIAAIANEVSRECVQIEFDTAPNLVLAGASTQAIKAAIGMSDQQLENVARLALTLP